MENTKEREKEESTEKRIENEITLNELTKKQEERQLTEKQQEKEQKKRQTNVSLYPKYKMLSWDLLFYYAISFLFFTEIKGIHAADVLLADAWYPFFKMFLLVPCTILIDKIGKRKSLITGNFFVALSTLILILATNFEMILLGQFVSAIGYVIKGICETNMLYDSLEKNEKRGAIFSKIDGRASSLYYYIDAVSSVISGFLFAINGYLPFILCLLINIVSVIMSLKFEENDEPEKQEKVKLIKEFVSLGKTLKGIFQSPRLRNLLVFGTIIAGIMCALSTLRSSLLNDIGISSQYFGIIFAVLQIVSGIAAKNQYKIHTKFRNKTLASISLPLVISCIFLGLLCDVGLGLGTTIIVVLAIYFLQYVCKRSIFYTN